MINNRNKTRIKSKTEKKPIFYLLSELKYRLRNIMNKSENYFGRWIQSTASARIERKVMKPTYIFSHSSINFESIPGRYSKYGRVQEVLISRKIN